MGSLFSSFLVLAIIFVGTPALAQTVEAPNTDLEDGLDTGHDIPANDPSVGVALTLQSPLSQTKILWHGVNRHINHNIRTAFHHAKADYRKASAEELSKNDELFKIHEYRYEPKKEYGPTTINADHEYKDISSREFGFCWGYATLVRNFTTLAFYNQSKPKNPDLDFYKEKIDEVLSGKAVVIPGFANFRDLSLVPELEFYLKLNAMEMWKTRAVRHGSVGIFRHATKSMTPDEVDTLVSTLENNIAKGMLPKILFSALIPSATVLGLNADIHAVLAYKVEHLANHTVRIHLWDINFYTETLVREPKILEITPDRGILYAPWYEPHATYAAGSAIIARVLIAPEDDAENLQMLKGLKDFCNDPETATYCTGSRID